MDKFLKNIKSGTWVAVIGSRSVKDENIVFSVLDRNKNKIALIVSGGCNGPDTFAENWARKNGVPIIVFNANWRPDANTFDKGAGFKRNRTIIENCDAVLAFWDGISEGTKNSIDIANQLNKKLIIIQCQAQTK